jgi:uncharacterized membrane protein YfcA
MNSLEIFSHLVVFAAAFLQSATGIGFGIIAGPVILIMVDSHAAVQVTMGLSFAVSLALAPTLVAHVDRPMLKRLSVGTIIGLPIGMLVFWAVSLPVLKFLAMLAVAFMAWTVSRVPQNSPQTLPASGGSIDLGIGIASGVMSTALAMPGPAAAARLATLAMPKETVRATVLLLMVASYFGALIAQAGLIGIDGQTIEIAAWMLPAALIGTFGGRLFVPYIDEALFRRIITVLLIATSVGLLADVGLGAF